MPRRQAPSEADWQAMAQIPRSNGPAEAERLEWADRKLGRVLASLWELAENWPSLGRSSSLSLPEINEMAQRISKAQSEAARQYEAATGGVLR